MNQKNDQEAIQASTNLLARVFSLLILTMLPLLATYYADVWLGTRFVIYIGVVVSIAVGIAGLWGIQKLTQESLRTPEFREAIRKAAEEKEAKAKEAQSKLTPGNNSEEQF